MARRSVTIVTVGDAGHCHTTFVEAIGFSTEVTRCDDSDGRIITLIVMGAGDGGGSAWN